jgi:hypothetical protein
MCTKVGFLIPWLYWTYFYLLAKNMPDSDIVNGSLGLIVDFLTPSEASSRGYEVLGTPWGPSAQTSTRRRPVRQASLKAEWPLVAFADGGTYLVTQVEFKHENELGELKARRRQVRLGSAGCASIN